MLIRPTTHSITIVTIEHSVSNNVVMIYCKIDKPDLDIESIVSFKAGQFMLLQAHINGQLVKRSYSIATTPTGLSQNGIIGFSIKRVAGGVFSERATQTAQIGDSLTMTGPLGHMIDVKARTNYLLISAGSGLSPIYSIYHDLLMNNPDVRIANLFGEKTYADMLELVDRDWVREVDRRVYSQCFLSQDDYPGYQHGRVQVGIQAALNRLNCEDLTIFICGGPEMVDDVRRILIEDYGFSIDQIMFEKY